MTNTNTATTTNTTTIACSEKQLFSAIINKCENELVIVSSTDHVLGTKYNKFIPYYLYCIDEIKEHLCDMDTDRIIYHIETKDSIKIISVDNQIIMIYGKEKDIVEYLKEYIIKEELKIGDELLPYMIDNDNIQNIVSNRLSEVVENTTPDTDIPLYERVNIEYKIDDIRDLLDSLKYNIIDVQSVMVTLFTDLDLDDFFTLGRENKLYQNIVEFIQCFEEKLIDKSYFDYQLYIDELSHVLDFMENKVITDDLIGSIAIYLNAVGDDFDSISDITYYECNKEEFAIQYMQIHFEHKYSLLIRHGLEKYFDFISWLDDMEGDDFYEGDNGFIMVF